MSWCDTTRTDTQEKHQNNQAKQKASILANDEGVSIDVEKSGKRAAEGENGEVKKRKKARNGEGPIKGRRKKAEGVEGAE
jgi:hypothetical protein